MKRIQKCVKCKDRIGEPRYGIPFLKNKTAWIREGHMLPDQWDKIQAGVEITTCPDCEKEV